MKTIEAEIVQIEKFVFLSTGLILLMVLLFIFILIDTKRKLYLEDITIKLIKAQGIPRLVLLQDNIRKMSDELSRLTPASPTSEKSEET